MLTTSRAEEIFVRLRLRRRLAGNCSKRARRPSPTHGTCEGDQLILQRTAAQALWTTIARTLTGEMGTGVSRPA
jgi:hypothetical protein